MKKKSIFVAIAFLIVIAIFIIIYAGRGKESGVISTAGIIEGTEVNLSPEVSGNISYMCCKEGDYVKEGDIVFKLESSDLRALVAQAEAGVRKAKAAIRVSESGIENARANIKTSEADIKTAGAGREKARVQMELAKKEMDRAETLYKQDFVSKDSVDVAVTQYNASVADYESSKSSLVSVSSKKDAAIAQLNTAEHQLASARADLKQSEANLAYNVARLDYTTVISPISGIVVLKAMEKGEPASPGMTVLTIVDMNDLWARVDIDETLIDNVALNGEALISPEGTPKRIFKGRVSEIGRYAEFATQKEVTRGRQDIKTFRVRIRFGDTGGALKPGMTVEVEIPKKK
jgi:multidrug resistance efflux pump